MMISNNMYVQKLNAFTMSLINTFFYIEYKFTQNYLYPFVIIAFIYIDVLYFIQLMVTCIFIKNANYVGKMSSDIFCLPFATRNLDSGIRKILALFHLESWAWNPEYKSRNLESCVLLVCYAAVFDVIMHDDSKNGCVADQRTIGILNSSSNDKESGIHRK